LKSGGVLKVVRDGMIMSNFSFLFSPLLFFWEVGRGKRGQCQAAPTHLLLFLSFRVKRRGEKGGPTRTRSSSFLLFLPFPEGGEEESGPISPLSPPSLLFQEGRVSARLRA